MKKSLFCLFLCLALLFLPACSASAGGDREGYPGADAPGAAWEDSGDTYNKGGTVSDPSYANSDALPADRVMIKTVDETVETLSYDNFLVSLRANVGTVGGYFSSSSYRENNSGLRSANFTVRVPADRLSDFCGRVEGIGTVTYFYERVDDVTLSYVSIESRIEVLVSEESALLAILAQADNVTDMLTIRAHLEDVQGELASLRAQKRVYDDGAAFSTVNMTVYEVRRVSDTTEDTGFFAELGKTFRASLLGLSDFFCGLGIFLLGNSPVILLLALVSAVVILVLRHILKKERARVERNRENRE